MKAMILCAVLLLAFGRTASAADGAVSAFSASFDGFSSEARPFPEKFELIDGGDNKALLTFGKDQPWRLVNFWAVWCPPCVAELPTLKALKEKHAGSKTLEIMLVSADMPENAAALKTLMHDRGLPDIDTYYVNDMFLWQAFDLKGLPTTLLVSPEGQIVYTLLGDADWTGDRASAFFAAVLP